jgi:hypothetical protein
MDGRRGSLMNKRRNKRTDTKATAGKKQGKAPVPSLSSRAKAIIRRAETIGSRISNTNRVLDLYDIGTLAKQLKIQNVITTGGKWWTVADTAYLADKCGLKGSTAWRTTQFYELIRFTKVFTRTFVERYMARSMSSGRRLSMKHWTFLIPLDDRNFVEELLDKALAQSLSSDALRDIIRRRKS